MNNIVFSLVKVAIYLICAMFVLRIKNTLC